MAVLVSVNVGTPTTSSGGPHGPHRHLEVAAVRTPNGPSSMSRHGHGDTAGHGGEQPAAYGCGPALFTAEVHGALTAFSTCEGVVLEARPRRDQQAHA